MMYKFQTANKWRSTVVLMPMLMPIIALWCRRNAKHVIVASNEQVKACCQQSAAPLFTGCTNCHQDSAAMVISRVSQSLQTPPLHAAGSDCSSGHCQGQPGLSRRGCGTVANSQHWHCCTPKQQPVCAGGAGNTRQCREIGFMVGRVTFWAPCTGPFAACASRLVRYFVEPGKLGQERFQVAHHSLQQQSAHHACIHSGDQERPALRDCARQRCGDC